MNLEPRFYREMIRFVAMNLQSTRKVITGRSLDWLPAQRQDCPVHHCDLTIYHIFIECTVSMAVWQKIGEIWLHIDRTEFIPPRVVDKLIACMAMSPVLYKPRRRRWLVLYQTAVWALWKAYLSHSFDLPHAYWNPEAARGYYRELINSLILSNRVLSTNEKYRNHDYNEEAFEKVWGENPKTLKVLRGPRCLHRPIRV